MPDHDSSSNCCDGRSDCGYCGSFLPTCAYNAELRAAADKIRHRAEAATAGPWKADHPEYPESIRGGELGSVGVVAGSRWNGEANVFDNNDDAYHIALWHPGIAELVAQILDAAAQVAQDEYEWIGTKVEVLLVDELRLARAINATEVA